VHLHPGVTRIEAIIRPSKLEALRAALSAHPWVSGMTVCEVKGFGRSRGHEALYRGGEYRIDFLPKVKVEVVVPDPLVPRIVHELETAMRTGRIGDGKIFISPVEEAIRVRTGDRGEDAL
jgi:nitrogen regulatory protein P-II 1